MAKKEERQAGDMGLYRFYLNSVPKWQYGTWIFILALAVAWNQMPGKPEQTEAPSLDWAFG